MPEIIVKLGDNIVQKYFFTRETIQIGRGNDNEIVIDNLSISRNHASIEKENGHFVLNDLDSSNGCYVNGIRAQRTILRNKDVITIGKHKLYFYSPENKAKKGAGVANGQAPASRVPLAVRLEVVKGKQQGMRYEIVGPETRLGRGNENQVRLGDWFVSKTHAVIENREGNFILRDLGSWRHTFVNGEVIDEKQIYDGDEIQFGPTVTMRFTIEDDEPGNSVSRAMMRKSVERSLAEDSKPPAKLFKSDPNDAAPAAPADAQDSGLEALEIALARAEEKAAARKTPAPEPSPPGIEASSAEEAAEPEAAHHSPAGERAAREVEAEASVLIALSSPTMDSTITAAFEGDSGEPCFLEIESEKLIPIHSAAPQAAPAETPSTAPAGLAASSDAPASTTADDGGVDDKSSSALHDDEAWEEECAAGENASPVCFALDPLAAEPKSEAEATMELGDAPEMKSDPAINPVDAPVPSLDHEATEPAPAPIAPAPTAAAIPAAPAPQAPSEIPEDKVALWERALQNKSIVIRRQAARELKKLTGRDYAIE